MMNIQDASISEKKREQGRAKGVREIIDSTLNMKKTSKVKDSMGKIVKRPSRIKDEADNSVNESFLKDIEGQDFEEFDKDDHEVHGKSGKHYRVVGRPGDKRHSVSWAPKEYDWDNGGEFPVEGESAKELGRRLRGVRDSKRKVKDSSAFDFYISEDNVYDLIHEGSTSVAIPSGEDTKAFVAAAEDIIKDVAKDCGYGNIKVETEIEGNMLNIFKK